jgi:Mn2+/Fe2+ NRAMP family transporter
MGDYANGRAAQILGWLTVLLMGAAAVALFATGGY